MVGPIPTRPPMTPEQRDDFNFSEGRWQGFCIAVAVLAGVTLFWRLAAWLE